MKKDKQTEMRQMENQTDMEHEIEMIGSGLLKKLNKHYEQWECGLPYKTVLSPFSPKAKSMGLALDDLSEKLEDEKYIKVFSTPNGKRFVFSGDCPLSNEEIRNWIQDQEVQKETEKELKKLSAKGL